MKEFEISPSLYREALFDITEFFYREAIYFFEREERYFGKVKNYMDKILGAYEEAWKKLDGSEVETYGKVLNFLKKQICLDFYRLKERGLTPADRLIVMVGKLLYIINELETREGTVGESRFAEELKIVKKYTSKMWLNIKSRAKTDSLFNLSNRIYDMIDSGKVGKYTTDLLDFVSREFPEPKKLDVIGTKEVILNETPGKTKEVRL